MEENDGVTQRTALRPVYRLSKVMDEQSEKKAHMKTNYLG